jgi:DNA-binding transcriptional MocR family regulator
MTELVSNTTGICSPAVDAAASQAVGATVRELEPNVLRKIVEHSLRPGMISLAGGMPPEDLFDLEGIQQATRRVLEGEADVSRALQYGETEGNLDLRRQVARLMDQRGVRGIEPESVLITTGASQGIDLAARALLEPGDVLAVERPTFLATLSAAQLSEAQVAGLPIDENGLLVEGFESLLKETPVKALYVMPTFSNPSGAVLSLERRRRLLEVAQEHGVVVVEDDAYGPLWFAEAPPPSLLALAQQMDTPPVCVHLSTLSKIVAPGLRLGWAIAPPSLLERLTVVKQIADVHTSSLDQAIAAAYLEDGRLPSHLERLRAGYEERSRWLTEAIREEIPAERLQFSQPRGGMFLWCLLTEGSARETAKAALEQKVTVVRGDPFFPSAPENQCLRLSYSKLSEGDARKAAKRLAAAIL